jgi:hypothetical protein
MTMKISNLSLLPVLLIAAACGGSGSDANDNSLNNKDLASVSQAPTDAEIMALAYDPEYSVPAGFFVDERAETTNRSYSLHHVLDASNSYELCTNDLVEAQAWEQSDNDSRAVNGYYVTSIENDRYFEFVRELDYTQDLGNITDPTSPGYARVFKCDYADRNGVDRNLLDGYSGMLPAEAAAAQRLREFTEYLWQFRFFNVQRKIVVESNGGRSGNNLTHTLLLAFVVNQGSGRCDRVDVTEWRFTRDSSTGEVTRDFQTIRSFEAELISGVPQTCS